MKDTILRAFSNRAPVWNTHLVAVFFAALILIVILFRCLKFSKKQWIAGIFLYGYTYNVLISTLLMRIKYDEPRYDFEIFHQIKLYAQFGDKYILAELLLNFIMFVPIGFLLPFTINVKFRHFISALMCVVFTASIETCQLVTKLGEFQTDDIIMNAAGGIFGVIVALCINMIVNRMKNEDSLQKVNENP